MGGVGSSPGDVCFWYFCVWVSACFCVIARISGVSGFRVCAGCLEAWGGGVGVLLCVGLAVLAGDFADVWVGIWNFGFGGFYPCRLEF